MYDNSLLCSLVEILSGNLTQPPRVYIPEHHQTPHTKAYGPQMKMTPQQYCLRWKHHHTNVQNMFAQLLEKERFCDVTLYCSPNFATQVPNKDTVDPQHIRGVSLRAHRVVLAACSELLGTLLSAHETQGEPVLVIDGAEPTHLKALLDYMYTGEMNVHHSQLASLLKTAEELRIKGLTDIRWNNKDEPPDCASGVVTAVASDDKRPEKPIQKAVEKPVEKQASPKPSPKIVSPKHVSPKHVSPKPDVPQKEQKQDVPTSELRAYVRKDDSETEPKTGEKFVNSVNGGPPPLIKLPTKEKHAQSKREHSDSESPSPKRQRLASGTEHTDDESMSHKSDRDQEWQHGNLVSMFTESSLTSLTDTRRASNLAQARQYGRQIKNITAERVVGWGMGEAENASQWSRSASDDEWDDAPADIGSFLHTRLRVDGDNSADEESNDSTNAAMLSAPASSSSSMTADIKVDLPPSAIANMISSSANISKPTLGPKSGPTDPRFTDVVKLSDYLQHGRRPQFWEEHYVKRVMEAVRVKELEMKQAAEILGVSYGTLYGRYRDVYGCINRPYRTARDFWQAKGPSEVLERLQRGDISIDAAALALGVSVTNLSAYVADYPVEKDFEPIPIEIDPSLKMRPRAYSGGAAAPASAGKGPAKRPDKPPAKKVMIGSLTDEDPIPATVITTHDKNAFGTTTAPSGKWPTIRVASLDSLRGADPPAASPSALMRTRPDLTIVAKKTETKKEEEEDT